VPGFPKFARASANSPHYPVALLSRQSELYHTGRWKRYLSEEEFLLKMRQAFKACDRWAEIAPTPPREASRSNAAPAQRSAA
jgi:hypothetical protein